jgi:CHAD domain-containing protein
MVDPTHARAGRGDGPVHLFSNGALAHGLVQLQLQRVLKAHQKVLDRGDPEPLHQMRVAMRRLRTTLQQFAPVLELPKAASDQRLAKSVRRLGLVRDLDVLQGRLLNTFLPQLPQEEVAALRPVLRTLQRERDLAQEHLEKVLRSSGHLAMVAALQQWLKKPQFTALADEPARDWLQEWHLPFVQELMLHPGWLVAKPGVDVDTLHDLRKQLKTARYRLENLTAHTGGALQPWVGHLRQGQDLLGELNDLQVLRGAIDDQLAAGLEKTLPQLHALLLFTDARCWDLWREQADALWLPGARRRWSLSLMRASLPAGPGHWVKGLLMRAAAIFA